MSFTIGSCFSGIGGLELGLERGIRDSETVWQIELAPYPRSILEKHWPKASRAVIDIREANADTLARVNLICGGFPCQDLSIANVKRSGFHGTRSSLWYSMSHTISELRPQFIVLENVANINSPNMRRVLARVLSDVSEMGYNCSWERLSARSRGANHLRNRWFLTGWLPNVANAESWQDEQREHRDLDEEKKGGESIDTPLSFGCADVAVSDGRGPGEKRHWDAAFEPVDRVVNGLSPRMVKLNRLELKALGNSVVPQCGEAIGRRVQEIREILYPNGEPPLL